MKVPLCLCLLFACTLWLHAQEAETDTVATEEEYQYIEESTDDDDYTEEETPGTTHELVQPDQLPTTQDHARQKMDVRKFDDKQWKEVIGTTTFEEKADKKKDKEKEKKKDRGSADSNPFDFLSNWNMNGDALRIIAYILVFAIILGVIYLFTKDLQFKVKVKPSVHPQQDLTAALENIEHIEIFTPLQEALAAGNFKLVTRLYFLDLLKRLNETGMITWKKDRTNRDYLMEISVKGYHFEEIRKLTLAYELVWYGEHALSNEAYQKLFSAFESIFQKINTQAAA